jgi:hypothetical protein
VGRAATRSYSCCSWGMRKLEAASVRKMLHRRSMRRRGGVGKGSVFVTGDVCSERWGQRVPIAVIKGTVRLVLFQATMGWNIKYAGQWQCRSRASSTYQVGRQLPREGVGERNHVVSYYTASVGRTSARALHSHSSRNATVRCSSLVASVHGTCRSWNIFARWRCLLRRQVFTAGRAPENVSETTFLPVAVPYVLRATRCHPPSPGQP